MVTGYDNHNIKKQDCWSKGAAFKVEKNPVHGLNHWYYTFNDRINTFWEMSEHHGQWGT